MRVGSNVGPEEGTVGEWIKGLGGEPYTCMADPACTAKATRCYTGFWWTQLDPPSETRRSVVWSSRGERNACSLCLQRRGGGVISTDTHFSREQQSSREAVSLQGESLRLLAPLKCAQLGGRCSGLENTQRRPSKALQ